MRKINDKYYMPFSLKDPQHKDYLRMKAWVRNFLGEERLITRITDRGVYAGEDIVPEILLRDWTFLDGEPCGVEEKKSPSKSIIFFTDRESKYVFYRKNPSYLDIVEVDYYDDLMRVIKNGTANEIITPLAIALSPEIRQLGYKQFIAREGKLLELKEGLLEGCGIDLKDYQDFLKMFLSGDFDSYWKKGDECA